MRREPSCKEKEERGVIEEPGCCYLWRESRMRGMRKEPLRREGRGMKTGPFGRELAIGVSCHVTTHTRTVCMV